MQLTRSEIQEQIITLISANPNKDMVKNGVKLWLEEKKCPPFDTQQIMNDLTSYKEYLELLN
jgi:hypothetical protein